ncbi:DUF4232 domain-containing protein [Streptomyces sp. NPDC001816]|uniref:DUF4232 domain-containing protein n=1 Tax=Streptomyces sp. NPDC001816 TaxID=3364612 RepID=UPI0036973C67
MRFSTATVIAAALVLGLGLTACGDWTDPADIGAVDACTTEMTTVRFTASASHASESEPAVATIKITNTSGGTCVIADGGTLTAKDDQGKSDPVESVNHPTGTHDVTLAPGVSATADVLYTDVNFEGSASAREVCGVQASRVQITLPKNFARTVKVTKADGSAGAFNVCTPDGKFEDFHG